VGKSPAFLACINSIPPVAQCDASVLISGETGTGKELCARAIHYLSPRSDKPFLPVTCGAIPAELVENELFGHVQGAYTSANTTSSGLIREAEGGTLFLDEIDCLPLQAQVKLMRVLQEKEYRQLGSPKIQQADIRIIAATNIDLEQAIRHNRFRADLFYRLNIIPLALPPLRERKEDIPLLALHFLKKYAPEFKREVSDFSPEAMLKLLSHQWPGNVRELENLIERAVIFSQHHIIQRHDIVLPDQPHPHDMESFKDAKSRCIEKFEKDYIRQLLLEHRGNITQAAKAAHKNRRAFWELLRKYNIEHQHFKPGHS
jgi:DNA-binding NtrC family response regulator